jgi:hypothetical protein
VLGRFAIGILTSFALGSAAESQRAFLKLDYRGSRCKRVGSMSARVVESLAISKRDERRLLKRTYGGKQETGATMFT